MPTYEYECTKCGAVTDVFQSITEKQRRKLKSSDQPTCDCNATVKRRIGTGGGIIFKGSGFYGTDYRSDSYKKAAEADKPKTESKDKKGDKTGVKKKAETTSKKASSSGESDS